MSKEKSKLTLKPGLTWRSIMAILFSSVALLPVNLYLQLVSGTTIVAAAVYITAILFTEIATLMGSPLTKQEVYIIFTMAGIAATPVFINSVFRAYFTRSFIAWSFRDPFTGKPLPELIPRWYAPPYWSPVHKLRTFLHPDWIYPIIVFNIQYGLLAIIAELALTMITSIMYIEVESLPFPFAEVNAQLINTLTERQRERMYVFVFSAFVSMAYSIIVYGVPTLTAGLFNVRLQLIPIPWLDLTTGYLGIEKILPGACLGISTDPIVFATGFILPLNLEICMFIGSLVIWVFGNSLALTTFRSYFPEWAREWRPGMSLSLVWQRSYLRIWAFTQIGFIIGLAMFTVISEYKHILNALKTLFRPPTSIREKGYFSLRTLLAMYLGATSLSVVVFHLLVPEFPLWIAIVCSIGLSLVNAIIGTRILGETGLTITLPYVWQISVMLSGYRGIDAWLFSPLLAGSLSPGWTQSVKTAYLTDTRPLDFFKAFIITFVLYQAFSFIYVSFFWSIAPIPSSVYPWTLVQWPIQAINQGMWITRKIMTRPELIIYSLLTAIGLGVANMGLRKFLGISFSTIGIVTGFMTIPPSTITILMGGLIGKYVFQRILRESWQKYKTVIVAGIAAGEGIIVGIMSALVLVSKSTWILPY
mgnify:CR=1 FL=1